MKTPDMVPEETPACVGGQGGNLACPVYSEIGSRRAERVKNIILHVTIGRVFFSIFLYFTSNFVTIFCVILTRVFLQFIVVLFTVFIFSFLGRRQLIFGNCVNKRNTTLDSNAYETVSFGNFHLFGHVDVVMVYTCLSLGKIVHRNSNNQNVDGNVFFVSDGFQMFTSTGITLSTHRKQMVDKPKYTNTRR